MRIWFTPQYRPVVVAVFFLLVTVLALLAVLLRQGLSERTVAASFLVLSFMVFAVGGVLFAGRAMWNWPVEDLSRHLIWERSSIILATLITVLGLALLEDLLREAGDTVLSQLGMVAYLFGAAIVTVAETAYLSKREWNYAQVVVYVLLALPAQAAFGAALLQTGLVAAWAGWTAVVWNLGMLLVMGIVRPRDVYYPVIHFVAPLAIGIAMLAEHWI